MNGAVTYSHEAAESARTTGLREYGLVPAEAGEAPSLPDAEAAKALDNLVQLAARLCAVPYSVVNVITEGQQIQIAAFGVDAKVCSREDSMCAQVFLRRTTTVVRDASQDPRFAGNPFVTGEIAKVRFYASVPLQTASGLVLGSLCVFSDDAASPQAAQIAMLEVLAQQVVELLELQHRTLQLNDALAELRRSNTALGDFAGRVSHDLRIPLTTILGYVELAEDDPDIPQGSAAAEYFSRIAGSGRRMQATLKDVLDYSTVGGQLFRERFSLLALTAEAAGDLGQSLGGTIGIHCDDAELVADRAQIRTLLQNLIANSLNYRSPEHALHISISAVTGETGTAVSVADNGKGIEAADRQRAMEPLVRLQRAGDGPGSGLGLATCRRIAKAHGGELRISETPGGGTTVSVWIAA
ncbi:GAF domain-containing sensor histidine kinase [Pseudarthrobacter sp. S3]|uniref:sensor histidine kinase n=1 Tax=Pseudarthrobacter sp. S3 TaxID=3418419 RepID=UPI003393CCB0